MADPTKNGNILKIIINGGAVGIAVLLIVVGAYFGKIILEDLITTMAGVKATLTNLDEGAKEDRRQRTEIIKLMENMNKKLFIITPAQENGLQ